MTGEGEGILIRPLTRLKKAAEPYKRLPEVEAEILELLALGIEERMERLSLTSPTATGYVRPETLVYFMRDEARANRDGCFRVLYPLVMNRYLSFFRTPERQVGEMQHTDGTLEDLRRHAADRFVEKILKDKQEGDDRLDIYEVVFGYTAARDRWSAGKAIRRRSGREEQLNPADDERALSPEVEVAAAEMASISNATDIDASNDRKRVLMAIDALPEKYRRVATMTMNNIPTESLDPDAPTISKLLGCTPKTARARKEVAIRMIQKALGLEELT